MQSCLKHREQCQLPLLLFLKSLFSDSVAPVLASVSASDSALASSSGSGFSSVPPRAGLITNEPLSGGQSDHNLFQKLTLFLEWVMSTRPPSSALPSLSSASYGSVFASVFLF